MRGTASLAIVLLALAGVVRAAVPDFANAPPKATAPGEATAVFAGGCFWGVDAVFKHVKGVKNVVSGLFRRQRGNGQVHARRHRHDGPRRGGEGDVRPGAGRVYRSDEGVLLRRARPDGENRQGPDVGTQYRSAIFYADPQQKELAQRYIAQLEAAKAFGKPIVTEVAALDKFYPAEDYHQNYLALHPNQPYIVYNDLPKLQALKQQFPAWYRP